MPNDNTHTGIDWIAKIRSVDKDVNMASAVLTEHGFLSVCEWAVKTYLSHTPAEPKAGDWDAVLLDTLLYSQGHGIKTPPHEDPSDILDEYEKSIPDGAYRESIRSIRRALSSAASQPKAGDWDKELEEKSWTPSAGAQSRAVWLSVAKDILRRALSSAAPRITEKMVERVLDGIRVRGNTDRHHGIRTGIEKAKLAMIALLRQQGQPPFTPTQTEE